MTTEKHLLTEVQLVEILTNANTAYRNGHPIMSDYEYDHVYLKQLKELNPSHPYLNVVEPEQSNEKVIKLPAQMLSTNKAYSKDKVMQWANTCLKHANKHGVLNVIFKATAKLDGYAIYDDGVKLYTRGDGEYGSDVSRLLDRGVHIVGETRGLGPGELVVRSRYFNDKLSHVFDNSRNFMASIIKGKKLSEISDAAVKAGAVVFYPFSQLPSEEGDSVWLENEFEFIVAAVLLSCIYDTDGVVFEVVNPELKKVLGNTNHHHRWQIAFKQNTQGVETEVVNITHKISRYGVITPVASITPIQLDGVIITTITGHNYGLMKRRSIGVGSKVLVVRAGKVIPKIERVLSPGIMEIPGICHECGSILVTDELEILCKNPTCKGVQIEKIIHFFTTLSIDGFGRSVITKLYLEGFKTIPDILNINKEELEDCGIGTKTATNLLLSISSAKQRRIPFWKMLFSLSYPGYGEAKCKVVTFNTSFKILIDEFPEMKIFSTFNINR